MSGIKEIAMGTRTHSDDAQFVRRWYDLGRLFRWTAIGVAVLLVLSILSGIVFLAGWVSHVENYELGYTFDSRTGKIEALPHAGYVITPPFLVKVNTIDLRPMQLCISANKRMLNCKLAKFDPAGLETFVSWHGRGDYDIDIEMTGSLRDILKSYAFDGSGTSYPFLIVLPSSTGVNAHPASVEKLDGGNNTSPPAQP